MSRTAYLIAQLAAAYAQGEYVAVARILRALDRRMPPFVVGELQAELARGRLTTRAAPS